MNQTSRGSGNKNSRHVSNQVGRSHSSKRPHSAAHSSYGRECRQLFNAVSENETNFSKQTAVIPNSAASLYVSDSTSDLGEIHSISPPLPYSMYNSQTSENSLGIRSNPLQFHSNFQNTSEINTFSALPINFTSLRTDVRLSPIHFQNAAPFFHSTPRESWQENEGSPCKKQKITHHVPENLTSRWEQRRPPRQTHTQRRRNSCSKKLRYTPARICHRSDPYRCINSPPHHTTTRHTLCASPPTSPLQPTFVSQVPITVPVSIYASPHFTVCQGNGHASSSVHNVYSSSSAHYQVPSQCTNCIPAHQHSFTPSHISPQHLTGFPPTYINSPPSSPVQFPQSRSSDNLLSSSPPIFISENNHNAQMELNPRSRSTVNNLLRSPARRWRYHPFQSSSQYTNVFQFLAMFTPLSPPEIGSPESDMENYDALLNVAARLSEKRPRGLNKVEINQIPTFKFETSRHRGDQTSCVVCMCDFEDRQTLRHLPCSHNFHAKCVDKWLKTNCTCPICRGVATVDPMEHL